MFRKKVQRGIHFALQGLKMMRLRKTGCLLFIIALVISRTSYAENQDSLKPVLIQEVTENKGANNPEIKSIFGTKLTKIGSGAGLMILYDFSQFGNALNPLPAMIVGQGYLQFGRYFRLGGFATLGLDSPVPNSSRLASAYAGPLIQVTWFLEPVILAFGSRFGVGKDFNHPDEVDFMINPHIDVELLLFKNISLKLGTGFLKSRFSNTRPALAEFNINFGITLLKFSTQNDQKNDHDDNREDHND